MFDPVTAELIRNAAPLPGLDPATLVDTLTTAYVEIAAARLRVGGSSGVEARRGFNAVGRDMSRLADTYEAEIVLDVQHDHRRSMAFVAGSARQVLGQIDRLIDQDERPSLLNATAIGAEIAAALLFLIAERSSDAYEASRDIRAAGEPNPIRRALILSVGRFARGQFEELATIDLEDEPSASSGLIESAVDVMYREILRALIMLARVGLGINPREAIETARGIFKGVARSAISNQCFEFSGLAMPLRTTSIFAGPFHLASLLSQAADGFERSMLVLLPAPAGAAPEQWGDWLRSEASRWPFLWENHRDAVATGYLDQGSSLVMTTPTGSGKSTLATLKIAATLACGKTVLYLAPTHALVSQIEEDLNKRLVSIAKAQSIENMGLDETVQSLPDVAVVTPERCFALLTFAPHLFANVGLLTFDEFHLLGVDRPATESTKAKVDRRGIDAMLCLLSFQATNATADYLLLSAMVSNGPQVASWLSALIGRPVIPFDYKWKPTRQLRSCVLYDRADLQIQRRAINIPPRSNAPKATPHGLFSLSNGWNPKAPDKLLVRPFSNAPLALGLGSKGIRRWLTANRYQVAASIAKQFSDGGLKVVVFCESVVTCGSVAKSLNETSEPFTSTRQADQDRWRNDAVSELGHLEAIYDVGTTVAAVHHGELLPTERRLVETMFKRRDSGVNVLAATSTLAQGLNLPCDVVVVASSDRLDDNDAEEKTRIPLMPHEILNALGRAGRAGQAATGFSIVIPGNPLGCDMQTKTVDYDDDVKVIFAEGDQCLPLEDPLGTLFDQIEVTGTLTTEADYLLRRLAISVGEEREGVETFSALTRRTLGYFQRSSIDPQAADAWLDARRAVMLGRLADREPSVALPWQEELAAKTGVSAAFIARLVGAFDSAPFSSPDADVWLRWLLEQLNPEETETEAFLRPESVGRVFGRAISTQTTPAEAREVGIKGTLLIFDTWFSGATLYVLEREIAAFVVKHERNVKRPTAPDVKAKRARRFAIRLAPDMAYLCGVFSQISEKVSAERGQTPPPMPTFLSQLVRLGYRTPYHYALSRDAESSSRVEVHKAFDAIADRLDRVATDDWNTIRDKLDAITLADAFSDLSAVDFEAIFQSIADTPPPSK